MKNYQSNKTLQIVVNALAIALVTIATLIIRIPTIKGYVNVGDIMIFTTAIILGKKSAFIAGSFGSALADIIGGYFIYAPATFFIKGLEGLICALIIAKFMDSHKTKYVMFISTIFGAAFMVLGYFVYEFFIFGYAVAFAGIPGNILQGSISAVAAVPLIIALRNTKYFAIEAN